MCCKKNHCLSIETVCLSFAIINVIANAANLLCYSLTWETILLYINRDVVANWKDPNAELLPIIASWRWNPGHMVFYICLIPLASFLTVIFSFMLCIGISTRRPGYVRAYIVYGTVITVLGLVAAMTLMCVDRTPDACLWMLLVCALHSLFLLLVLQTHRILVKDANYADNICLIAENQVFSK